jgi:hypothetical protein
VTYGRKPRKVRPNLDNLEFWGAAEDFVQDTHFDRDLIKDVVRFPTDTSRDPRSLEVGYNIYRFRRGDITVVVGFRDVVNPKILYVYLHDPEDHTRGKGTQSGGGLPSKTPTSVTDLQTWLRNQGCVMSWESNAGALKVSWHGHFVGNLHLTTHTQGASLKNRYHWFRKRLSRVRTEAMLRDDIELREKRKHE